MSDHLDTDLVAAYAERRLSRGDRESVEEHLAECTECREEAADVARLLRPARVRRRLVLATPAMAVAAVLTLMVARQPPGDDAASIAEGPRLRGAGPVATELPTGLVARSPAEGVAVPRRGLHFQWSSDGPDALYTLTVADTTGRPLWRANTTDTLLALPDSVSLVAGSHYHWWVDVLLADGRTASTGVRSMVLAR